MRELFSRVVALPGVEAAGAVYLRPLALGPIGQETSVALEGHPDTVEAARTNPTLNYQVATPGYFAAMRIRLERGRLFTDDDNTRSQRVVLVGASTARRLWPGQDPIGKRILMPTQSPGSPASAWRLVVGVVGDVRYRGVDDVRLDVYDAAFQSRTAATDLVVRTTGNPLVVAAAVQAEARRLEPHVVVDRLTTMDSIVSRAVAPWHFSAWMFTVFAALAFVLATVGLVSVVALDVADHRHEFAVRLALGAGRDHVLRFVLYKAIRSVMPGLILGSTAAATAARGIRSILFGVEPLDAGIYLIVLGLVSIVVTAAAYLPARRAAAIDPMALLRRD
jgi:hypothetical protein